MRLLYIISTILLFLVVTANAQFSISNYNSKSGFPHDLSYRINEDSLGYIYVGTDNGLVKYNGNEFVLYNDPNLKCKYIIDVLPISKNEIALATWGKGIHFLNTETYKSLPFTPSNLTNKHSRVLPLGNKLVAFDDKNELLLFEKKKEGLHQVYNFDLLVKNNKEFTFKKNDSSLYFSIDGFDKRVFVFSRTNRINVKGLIEIHADRSISDPFPFLDSYIIFGIQKLDQHYVVLTDIGLVYFNEKGILSIEKSTIGNKKALKYSENSYYKVFELEDNKTKLHEIKVISKANNSSFTVNSDQLRGALISQIYLSRYNSVIWISTYGNGLYKLVAQPPVFDKYFLESKNCIDFKSFKSYNLFLTVNELFILDTSLQLLHTIETDYSGNFNKNSEEVDVVGRYSYSGAYTKHFRDLKINFESKVRYRNFGSLKIARGYSSCTIIKINTNDTFQLSFKDSSNDLKNLEIGNAVKFGNAIYLQTNQGIFAFDTIQFLLVKSNNLALCKGDIIEIATRNNELWVATQNQLFKYSLDHQVNIFKLPDYFKDNFNHMLLAKNGDIWLASQKGFILFKNEQFYQINYKYGYSSSFTTKICESKNGDIYLLGNNGVSILKQNQHLLTTPPQLLVSSNSFNSVDSFAIFESGQSLAFKLDYMNYYGLDIVTEYQFNNQEWQVLQSNSLEFLNLKNGNYSLQFRSRFFNSDFAYSKKYGFEIKNVWYLRPFFLFLWTLILVGLLSYFLYKRWKRLKNRNSFLQKTINENKQLQYKVEEMRHNVAQDFHDELGNKMAGISMLSEKLLLDQEQDKKLKTDLLRRINRDSKELYSGIRDFVWAIDAKNDDLQSLIFTLTDFAEELFQHSGISFTVANHIENKHLRLPMQWNRQLLLLFKEVMTNSFKHSNATNVELVFDSKDDHLIVQFKDDGIGFDLAAVKRGNGLNSIYKRASKMKGVIDIVSNQGTIISFTGSIK